VSFIYRFGCTYRSIHITTLLFYCTLMHFTTYKYQVVSLSSCVLYIQVWLYIQVHTHYNIVILLYTYTHYKYQVVSFIYRLSCTYRSIHTTTLLFYYTLIHITSIKLCPLYTGLAVHTGSYTLQVSSYNKKYKYFLTNN
jgi:hypothetical protein